MKDKVIIIGGDSYLARQFIAANQDKFWFTVFSRKATGFRDETVLDDFFQIQLPQCKGAVVINFAAIVHNSKAAPELYQKINYELPLFLAQKSTEAGVYLFIQISTIAVYGSSAIINIDTPKKPENPYGESKLQAEKALVQLETETFRVCIVRPSMIYGAGAPGNMLRLIRLVQTGLPLPLRNAIAQRNFLYINNLVFYLSYLVTNKLSGEFILADNKGVSTADLIGYIAASLERKPRMFSFPFAGLMKKVAPSLHNKLFGQLRVSCNMPVQHPAENSVQVGINDMVYYLRSQNTL